MEQQQHQLPPMKAVDDRTETQRRTFTNWVKAALEEQVCHQLTQHHHQRQQDPGTVFNDLLSDFSDGTLLCRLAEILSGKTVKCNKVRALSRHVLLV